MNAERDERLMVAGAIRAIRGQVRDMGDSDVSRGVMLEWRRRAALLKVFRRADAKNGQWI